METTVNIAVLGNCTTDYLSEALVRACRGYQIRADVYNCPFKQYNQAVFDPESEFFRSNPELVILFLEGSVLFPEWYELETVMDGREKKEKAVHAVFESLVSLVEAIQKNAPAKVVLNNFRIPRYSPLGILDHKYYPGLKNMIALLNDNLAEWMSGKDGVYLFDYCALAADFGNENLEDPKLFYATSAPASLQFTASLAHEYIRYLLPLKAMTKKCLVLDLDNTLWGGVAGEDGISGIKLDINGVGRSFYDFQKELLNLRKKGVILAINSKNNVEDAMDILENHPHMVLHKDDFTVMKINWQDKVTNMREIAAELNIGTDSLVFFDDSSVERGLVKSLMPEVTVVDVPADTSKYTRTVKNLVEFERLQLTQEDFSRSAMYADNKKRAETQKRFGSVEEYLKSLHMEVIVEYANAFSIPRIAQLTQKTNQFNMTTKRYTQENIEAMCHAPDYLVLSCDVTDIFGDNGLTGVCIAKIENDNAFIDTFLLSCRVMGRNVEYAFLNKTVSLLRERGIKTIFALYGETAKNRANADFYLNAGFEIVADGTETRYRLTPETRPAGAEYIEVVMKGEL